MRIIFDQATPVPIRSHLAAHTVRTAAQQGWDRLKLLTTDKNMGYQQNLAGRRIAIVVLGQQQWPQLRQHIQRVVAAIDAAEPGSYLELDMP